MCLLLHLKIIEYLKNKKHPHCKPISEFWLTILRGLCYTNAV